MRQLLHTSRAPALILAALSLILLPALALGQQSDPQTAAVIERLQAVQTLLQTKQQELDALASTLPSTPEHEQLDLNTQIDTLKNETDQLAQSFERLATGAIDMELFGELETTFDWRDEVTQILQPLVANLKALTEKPRKIERLRSAIERNQMQYAAIGKAMASIEQKMQLSRSSSIRESLEQLQQKWQRRLDQNSNELELAQLQLGQLMHGDETWLETVKNGLFGFLNGRGLTLLLALCAGLSVWAVMRGLLWLFQFRPRRGEQDPYRTRRRFAQYAYRALSLVLILVAVVTVFYVRGDRLLMGLSIMAAAALALGLRHTIPRFLAETRLLLNIGAIRENERVIYNGIPWRVVSLNMFTLLRNPELTGVVRLPLGALSDMVSRPVGKEPWFPSSKGDYILLSDGSLQHVDRQTAETVELSNRGGAITSVPSEVFYGWTFENLSRGGSFGVRCLFGIDYHHLDISLDSVPQKLRQAVNEALQKTDYGQHVISVAVELTSAGSSSLDYGIFLVLHSDAAQNYLKIDRLVQQTCVAVCVAENWGIPFPHLTVQQYQEAA